MSSRRQFITLLGGAAAWPLAARAQQPERMRRIGMLMNRVADDPEAQARLKAFVQGLQQLGWAEGRNVRMDVRNRFCKKAGCACRFYCGLGFLIWAVRDSFDGEIRCRGRPMSQPRDDRQDDLFRPPLEEIINLRHPLVRLAGEIDCVPARAAI